MARCAFISQLEGTMFAHSAGRETDRLMHLERKRRFGVSLPLPCTIPTWKPHCDGRWISRPRRPSRLHRANGPSARESK